MMKQTLSKQCSNVKDRKIKYPIERKVPFPKIKSKKIKHRTKYLINLVKIKRVSKKVNLKVMRVRSRVLSKRHKRNRKVEQLLSDIKYLKSAIRHHIHMSTVLHIRIRLITITILLTSRQCLQCRLNICHIIHQVDMGMKWGQD